MCFSATASFVAGGTLSAAGVETLRHANTSERTPLAAIPLLFGVQQAIEGVVWISFGIPWLNALATHLFVLFSHVIWPAFIPFSVLMIEKHPGRRIVLTAFLLIGLATSLTLLFYALIVSTPIAHIVGNSVVYETFEPQIPLGLGFYVLATAIACIVSSHKMIRVFGMASLASFAIAYWSYQETFYSVWCFFAAILSFIIYIHLRMDVVEKIKETAQDLKSKAEKRVKSRFAR